jgi:multimeric flavodoxin WrbA
VLGVATSPRRGATDVLVQAALLGARSAGADTKFITLAGQTIAGCDGCDRCLDVGHCVITDGMAPIYPAMLDADVIVVGTPVYFGAPSALCKAMMERVEGFGIDEKALRFKIGGALAVAASDHGGQESAMAALHLWFQINEMIPIGITTPGAGWGVGGRSVEAEDILNETVKATATGRSILVTEAAWLYGAKLVTHATIVRAGIAATGLDLPNRPYGADLPAAFPDDISQLRLESTHPALTPGWSTPVTTAHESQE